MFEAVFDYKKRQNSEKEEREHQNSYGDSNVRIHPKSFEKLVGPPKVTVDFSFALKLGTVEAENREIAGVESVLEKGNVE